MNQPKTSPADTAREGSIGGRIKTALDVVISGTGGLGAAGILLLLVLICADIVLRFLFNSPIRGVAEIVSLSIVGIVFLQLGRCLRADRFTRADVLINLIGRRRPRLAAALNAVYCLCGAAVFAVLVYGCVPRFVDAFVDDITVGVHGQFVAPVWPVRAIIVIGSAIATVIYLAAAWRHIAEASGVRPSGNGATDATP